MTVQWNSRSEHLEQLLDQVLDLDEEARASFLASDAVEPEFREELVTLLKAATAGPLDGLPGSLVSKLLAEHASSPGIGTANQRFGQYRLLRLLGEGGMASVWLAERDADDLHHQVAVKCLKAGLVTPESRLRFLREQQILAQLQHPYIARLYDVGITDEGVPFIIMEWIDGVPLTQYCNDHRLSIKQRLTLFQKVCSAVTYAHQNLVVHRDLKPANILVGADGEPKLLDFGIAKFLYEDATPVTRSGIYLLTPEYAAPEQFSHEPITTATDVYALGAILYELLSGLRARSHFRQRPTPEANGVTLPSEELQRLSKYHRVSLSRTQELTSAEIRNPALLAEQRLTTPERLRQLLRGDLDTIVLKALQIESARRYATVQAFSDDIRRYLEQQPIQARKDTWTYRTGKFLKRHALSAMLSITAVIILLTTTIVSFYQMQRAEMQTIRAEAQAQRADIETQRAATEAKHALAVSEFLTNLFEISDSGLPRDDMPTTGALLQDGAKRLRNTLNDTPEVKLQLLLLVGRIESRLGELEQAKNLLQEAVAIADEKLLANDERWLQAQTTWATLLIKFQPNQAQQLQETAIAKYRGANGDTDTVQFADALYALAIADRESDHLDEAITLSQQALEMYKRLLNDHHPKVQKALQNLGVVLSYAKRWDEAEVVQRASLALSRELYGEHNGKYASSLSSLAHALDQQYKGAEAEQMARQALAIHESVYDKPNLNLVVILGVLGDALLRQHKSDEAKIIYSRALELAKQQADHTQHARFLYGLGYVATEQQHYQEAEHLQREALALVRKQAVSQPSIVASILLGLADALVPQQHYAEAINILQEALTIAHQVYGNESEAEGNILYHLAIAEIATVQTESALTHAQDAVRILEKTINHTHPRLVDARIVQGKALNRHHDYAAAHDLLSSVVTQLHEPEASGDVYGLADALIELGRAQQGLGQADKALATWNEALTLQRAKQPQNTKIIAELETLIEQARLTTIPR